MFGEIWFGRSVSAVEYFRTTAKKVRNFRECSSLHSPAQSALARRLPSRPTGSV